MTLGTDHRPGKVPPDVSRARIVLAVVGALAAIVVSAPPAVAAQPPKLDVRAAIGALSTEPIYRAPGAVATFDKPRVRAALAPDMRLLVAPFTGEFQPGNNYATDDQYVDQVYTPLDNWATDHHIRLIAVTGLYVSGIIAGAAFGPSDIPELRRQTAYQDVTSALLGMINYLNTGAEHFASPPGDPIVPPTAAQLAGLTARLRADPVYNAPDRTDPITVPTGQVSAHYGFTIRVAAFAPLRPGQPMIDYATALAKQFPNDDIFVSYGAWLDVAGPHRQLLQSARDYAYGRYEDATLQQGVSIADRIGTILDRGHELIREHPFSRPQPTPYDLRHQIIAVAPWVLLGSALLLGGGSLLGWRRRRAAATRAEHIALRRESALATAAIATLGARLLDDRARSPEAAATAGERHATATATFQQARTAAAMREVREIAEQGEEALR